MGAARSRRGSYLVLLYLLSKVLYLVNVVLQLLLLNSLLGIDFSVYGYEVIEWMRTDTDWTNSPQVAFPRVTFCDFNVRRLGNVHRYTVQCVLPINLYTEKIYMFLWFWMLFVAIISFLSLISWTSRAISVGDRHTYIKNHLKMNMVYDKSEDEDREKLAEFVKNYLRPDGVFLLRLIGHNTNTVTVSEIIAQLWQKFPRRQKHLRAPRPTPPFNKQASVPSAPPQPIDDVDGSNEKQPLKS